MECLKHYMRLALPQMHRPIFVLLVCSMYQRLKSFSTAFVRCKSSFHGQTLAEHVSKLTVDDVELASKRLSVGLPNNGSAASRLLTAVSTSCKPIGHSNEAAAGARKKYFALRDYFGPQAVFFTFSPCDECSFRIRLYATSGKVRYYYFCLHISLLQNNKAILNVFPLSITPSMPCLHCNGPMRNVCVI